MNSNKSVRLSLDLPQDMHRRLKTIASASGKTIREMFIEAIPYIEENNVCPFPRHTPNEETAKAIMDSFDSRNLTEYESFEDMIEKCGLSKYWPKKNK